MQMPVTPSSTSRHIFPLPYYLLSDDMEAFRQGIQSDDVFWGVGSSEDLLASSPGFNCRRLGGDILDVYHYSAYSPATSSNSSIASYSPHTPSPALLPDTPLPLVVSNDYLYNFQNSPSINSSRALYPDGDYSALGLHGISPQTPPRQFCSSELAHALEERPHIVASAELEELRRPVVLNTFHAIPPSSTPSPCISPSLLVRSAYFDNNQQYCSARHVRSDLSVPSTTSDCGRGGTGMLPFVPDSSMAMFNFVAPAVADNNTFAAAAVTLDPRVFSLDQAQVRSLAGNECTTANTSMMMMNANSVLVPSAAPMVVPSSETTSSTFYTSALDLDLGIQQFKAESPAPETALSSPMQVDDDTDSDPEWKPLSRGRVGRRTASRSVSTGPKVVAHPHCSKHSPKKSSSSSKPCPTDRTYWCYACNRGFSRSADKDRHMETYHKLQGIPCHICKGTFSRADALRRHLLKGCSGKARKRRSRAWELAAQRAAENKAAASVKMEPISESLLL